MNNNQNNDNVGLGLLILIFFIFVLMFKISKFLILKLKKVNYVTKSNQILVIDNVLPFKKFLN